MSTPRLPHPTFAAALIVMLATTSPRAHDPRCTDGTWTIDDGPITIAKLTIGAITLTDGAPSLDAECRAVRWIVEGVEDATKLRALFVCRAPRRLGPPRRFPLRLRARIGDDCTHMLGAIGIRPLGQSVRFTATLADDGCAFNAECREDAYCATALGECDGPGRCEPRPVGCPDNVDPVCGCDGATYFNACEAAARGVNVAHVGPCEDVCGGIAGIPCPEGEFCELPAGQCDAADLQGQCVAVADACPEFYSPVCGCDGVSYANDCFRQQARVQKDHDGPCGGCTSVVDCRPNEFCQSPEGQCGAAGTCAFIEQACPEIYDPVCGCDGATYASRCHAAMHAVSIAHVGTCDPVCGGIAGIPCPEGQVCDLSAGTCGSADLQGKCVDRPALCPDLYAPVCGCDGVTYGNDCERLQHGAQRDHDGECTCIVVLCPPGSDAVDTNGDGCVDCCVPVAKCERACDCYAALGQSFCLSCPLLCPICGDFWQCEDGRCVERCGIIPPDVTSCSYDPAR